MKNTMDYKNHNHQETDKKSFKCPECGLYYKDKMQAEKCEAWCRKHHSCNVDITSHAIESTHKN